MEQNLLCKSKTRFLKSTLFLDLSKETTFRDFIEHWEAKDRSFELLRICLLYIMQSFYCKSFTKDLKGDAAGI